MINTIQQYNKTVGFYHKKRPYVIGFRNGHIARNVMYKMEPNPIFTLLKQSPTQMINEETSLELTIDSEATLFIPKNKDLEIKNEDLHIAPVEFEDFITYPYTLNVGIVIPYVLVSEDEEEFVYRSHVIDPMFEVPDLE